MSSFLTVTLAQFRMYKDQADRALAQVADEAFFHTLDPESNSLAVIVKHVGGNLRSRWTDVLASDGEKPDRDRDGEFEIRSGDTRASLMARWEEGWTRCLGAIESLSPTDLNTMVSIRGESMPVEAAI